MKKIKDISKGIGIERCKSSKDVKILWHPKSLLMWLMIVTMMGTVSLGAAKVWDGLWYDFLKYPRNVEEKTINHMIYTHLFTREIFKQENVMKVRDDCELINTEYNDGCIVSTLKEKDGKIAGFKVHATEQTLAMLAKKHTISIMKKAEAGSREGKFLGVHIGDSEYINKLGRTRGQVIRVYKDGCVLSYIIDDRYGNVKPDSWRWIIYNHSRRNN